MKVKVIILLVIHFLTSPGNTLFTIEQGLAKNILKIPVEISPKKYPIKMKLLNDKIAPKIQFSLEFWLRLSSDISAPQNLLNFDFNNSKNFSFSFLLSKDGFEINESPDNLTLKTASQALNLGNWVLFGIDAELAHRPQAPSLLTIQVFADRVRIQDFSKLFDGKELFLVSEVYLVFGAVDILSPVCAW